MQEDQRVDNTFDKIIDYDICGNILLETMILRQQQQQQQKMPSHDVPARQ